MPLKLQECYSKINARVQTRLRYKLKHQRSNTGTNRISRLVMMRRSNRLTWNVSVRRNVRVVFYSFARRIRAQRRRPRNRINASHLPHVMRWSLRLREVRIVRPRSSTRSWLPHRKVFWNESSRVEMRAILVWRLPLSETQRLGISQSTSTWRVFSVIPRRVRIWLLMRFVSWVQIFATTTTRPRCQNNNYNKVDVVAAFILINTSWTMNRTIS